MTYLVVIPDVLQIHILLHLDHHDLAVLLVVCTQLNKLTAKNDIWIPQLNKEFSTINWSTTFFNNNSAKDQFKKCVQMKKQQQKILKKISTLETDAQLETIHENERRNTKEVIPQGMHAMSAFGIVNPILLESCYRGLLSFFNTHRRQKKLQKLYHALQIAKNESQGMNGNTLPAGNKLGNFT